MTDRKPQIACWHCKGDGFYFVVPVGFNPFYAGAVATAKAMQRIECRCQDARVRIEIDEETSGED